MSWQISETGRGDNTLYSQAGTPSLDLRFSSTKSLTDYVTGTNLIDFTRASSGTYVGSDGLIKTATTNLLLRSEEFDDASWSDPSITWTASAVTAPNGTLTVLKTSETWTFWGFYDQTNAAWIAGYPQAFPFTVTNQWARQSVQVTAPAGCTTLRFYPGRVGGSGYFFYQAVTVIPGNTYTASAYYKLDTDGTVLIWGAQLEQSSTVGEYIPTTSTINSAPRFDHDPTTGESLGLLVEEQRTNLITDSSLTTIGIPIAAVISSTTETNPEGINFCQRILSDAGSAAGGHRIRVNANSANSITVSAFVKKDTHRYVYIGFGGASNSFTALFDIDPTVTGDRLLGQGGSGTYTNIDAGYQNFPNGWVRIWAAGTTTGTDGTTIGFSPDDSTYEITNWVAAGTEAIFIHGVQYEDNATFPTSYIPTTDSTVPRAADVTSISGTNFSSWYRQDAGTVFASAFNRQTYDGTNKFPYILQLDDGGNTERISFDHSVLSAGYRAQYVVRDNDVNTASITAKTGIATGLVSMSAAYGLNSFAASADGDAAVTDPSGTLPTVNRLQIGLGFGTQYNGTIRRLTYWPARLPDETLSTITQ